MITKVRSPIGMEHERDIVERGRDVAAGGRGRHVLEPAPAQAASRDAPQQHRRVGDLEHQTSVVPVPLVAA